MPPRRDPLKIRALPVLERDARTTQHEIDSAPTERKREELRYARDSARAELAKIVRTKKFRGEKLGALEQLRVNNVIKGLMARNRGHLARPKGGRPREHPSHLQLAVRVLEALEACEEKESTHSALKEVAERLDADYEYIKEIYYDYLYPDRDPELRLSVKAERAFSKENAEIVRRRAEIDRLASLPRSECERQLTVVSNAWGVDPLALSRLVMFARNKRDFAASRLYQQRHAKK
jgi:hypothetical protein